MTNLDNLKESTNKKFVEAVNDITQMKTLILQNKFFISEFKKRQIEYQFLETQNEIFKYRLFIGFLFSDLCSCLNFYLKAETKYEQKFAIRNLIVVINEGFKKIFNFEKTNDKGDIIRKYRNNSFWIKEIKPLLIGELEIYLNEFERISEKLEKFLEFDFDEKVPILLSFMDILDEMYFYTEQLGNHFRKNLENSHKLFIEQLTKNNK